RTSKERLEQRGKVLEFRRGFPEQGLYWSYKGKAEFVKHANDHLRKYIQQQISMHATGTPGKKRGPGAKRNANKSEGLFSVVVGKGGAVQFPIDMLRQLALVEGDSLDFTISDHRVIRSCCTTQYKLLRR